MTASAAKVVSVIIALLAAIPAYAEPHAGYMFQAVFDKSFPFVQAANRLCEIPNPVFSVGWRTIGNEMENFHELMWRVLACRPNAVVRISFEHGPARSPRAWRHYHNWKGSKNVADFNRDIVKSASFQRAYVKYLQGIKRETVDKYPTTKFIFFSIEDNFSCDAFTAVRKLHRLAFGSNVEIVRNKGFLGESCASDGELRREVHGVMSESTVSNLRRGDIYCPDGAFHAVPGDSNSATNPAPNRPRVASFEEAKKVAALMRKRGVWFEAWYPELQGITREQHSQKNPPHLKSIPYGFAHFRWEREIFNIHQGK